MDKSKKNWLSYYSKFFKFVEVDSTFYNIPCRFVVEGWKDKTPDDFKFSLEFPKIITHEKKMQNNNSIEFNEIIKEYFISFFARKIVIKSSVLFLIYYIVLR